MSVTNTPRLELSGIQMLRGFAALAVVIHHATELSNGSPGRFSPDWLTTSGAAGVDIFFVISGFIMFYVAFSSPKPLAPLVFLSRRITRIYPIYWLCCLAMLLALAVGTLKNFHISDGDVVRSFLLLPSDAKLIGVAWTLVYEMFFYLIFAGTLLLHSRAVTAIGCSAIMALSVVGAAALPGGMLRSFLSNPITFEFCFGLWLAWIFAHFTRDTGRWPVPVIASLIGVALLMLAPLIVAHPTTNGIPGIMRDIVWGVPAVLVVASFLSIRTPQRKLGRWLILLGDASYALYLTHSFVMIGYGRLLKVNAINRHNQIPMVLIIVAISVAVGIAAHLYAEKPLLQQIRKAQRRAIG